MTLVDLINSNKLMYQKFLDDAVLSKDETMDYQLAREPVYGNLRDAIQRLELMVIGAILYSKKSDNIIDSIFGHKINFPFNGFFHQMNRFPKPGELTIIKGPEWFTIVNGYIHCEFNLKLNCEKD